MTALCFSGCSSETGKADSGNASNGNGNSAFDVNTLTEGDATLKIMTWNIYLGKGNGESNVKILNYYVCHARDLNPVATMRIQIDDKVHEASASGEGQFDAFMRALQKIYQQFGRTLPFFADYTVTIPPGPCPAPLY